MLRRFFAPTALAGALCVLGGSAAAWAQSTLTYQGQVFGAHGPVDATYDMTFRLYESAEGGEALWSESFANVPVVDGVFLVELGVQNPLEEVARREAPLYIGISIGDNAEMTPRMLVGTALRAQWAAHARDVEGEDIHPRSLSIGGRLVIDESGRWLGEALGTIGPEGPAGPPGPAGADFDIEADADGDGFPDWLERLAGSNPNDAASRVLDEDQDGVPDVLRGQAGETGPAGERGPAGPTGPAGGPGPTGAPGPRGDVGAPGPAGPAGAQGEMGPAGPAGATGERGERGAKGDVGEIGPIGPPGPAGPQGPRGATGPEGPQGVIGPRGLQGVEGPMGQIGPQGPRGSQGEPGAKGAKGDTGETGAPGPTGERGIQGPRGEQGEIGPLGPQGPRGPQGETGPAGPLGPQGARGLQGEPGERGPMGVEGARGPIGETGPMGPIGPRGVEGAKGDKGDIGLMGPAGPKGDRGETGPIGPRGLEGPVGDTGLTGPAGPQGPRGVKGDRGDAGAQGPAGATGPQGDRGEKGDRGDPGPQGPTGATGDVGPAGAQGPRGEKGDRGDPGPTGSIGLTGDVGPAGPQGQRGEKGDRGDTGAEGPAGATGPQGPAGPAGPSGAAGPQGPQGEPGVAGPQGQQGPQGNPGNPGAMGPQGIQGPAGEKGASGDVGPAGPEGLPSLIALTNEPAGTNCPTGGKLLRYGTDVNRDGSLSVTETQGTEVLCNGPTGATGPAGEAGPSGAKGDSGERGADGFTTLTQTLAEAAGPNCAQGGNLVRFGADVDDDGILQLDEVQSSVYVCHGAQGQQGPIGATGAAGPKGDSGEKGATGDPGAKGDKGDKGDTGDTGDRGAPGAQGLPGFSTLVRLVSEAPGTTCPNGGQKIHFGKDQNENEYLDDLEFQGTQVVCNGVKGDTGDTGPQGPQGDPAPPTTWAQILDRPTDLLDGDDDALGGLTCSDGQIPSYQNSTSQWVCADDQNTSLGQSDVVSMVESASALNLSLSDSTQVEGRALVTLATPCQDQQILLFDFANAAWTCGDDKDTDTQLTAAEIVSLLSQQALQLGAGTSVGGSPVLTESSNLAWSRLTGIPADLADGDNDTTQPQWSDIQNIPADLADGDDGGIDVSCADGEILVANGGVWGCSPFSSAVDADSDGSFTWNDCNDNNPNLGDKSADADCDGLLTADDCNDNDSNSTSKAEDGDCDGVLSAAAGGTDCNDANASLGSSTEDGDCDGVLSSLYGGDDCNDNNANLGSQSNDGDCDGYVTSSDCDDGNAAAFDNNGRTSSCPANSCLEIYNKGYSVGNGTYYLNIGGVSGYTCDMNNGGWTVLYTEDFSSGSNGWGGSTTSCGSYGTILGGYQQFGSGAATEKTYSIPISHSQYNVSYDFIKIDSWDGENGYAYVDGSEIWSQSGSHGSGSNICGVGGGWTEDKWSVTRTGNHTAATLKLRFTSTLNQDASDESWGIDNVQIKVK